VGGQERGFDPAKNVEGRKRHLLVDTEGLVLKAKLHSARVPEADGIRLLLLESTRVGLSRRKHLCVGRCRLAGERQKVGRGGYGLERRGGTQAPKADP
jgi:hypothetical protein